MTEIVRRFASRVDPGVGTELTSTELLETLETRWGKDAPGELAGVVDLAERVKFGLHRPAAEVADADLERTASWIRRSPESR
jgi:hypothetical protein